MALADARLLKVMDCVRTCVGVVVTGGGVGGGVGGGATLLEEKKCELEEGENCTAPPARVSATSGWRAPEKGVVN
jgi:hypothetical protein